ncbi:hypothetical protein DFH11DRAFT_1727449 [Phellopilus nigrolimitatus]|nr:hypothetical protein DFH11DRAFT_1727449 [Phellopilus nigrolimitatus]
MAQNEDKYTDPELRAEIKENVHASDKGGQPGQWSARKAQMMASEYKKAAHERGEEPYTTDKSEQSDSQKHLSDWTKEKWQTSEGKASAKQEDGTEQRYLPKEAWENMTEEEKNETNAKKLDGSKQGKQYVPNTDTAKRAKKDAEENNADTDISEHDGEDDEQKSDGKSAKTSKNLRGTKRERDDEKETDKESGAEDHDDDKQVIHPQPLAKKAKGNDGEKRTTRSQSRGEGKDKTVQKEGEKSKEEHGNPGSATRLPNENQKVHWKAPCGWCEGTVVEITRSENDFDGIHAKASENDPRVVLQSAKSGKKAVHKPEAVYF